MEDAWWNVHCLPVRSESGAVAGIFCTVMETTTGVLAERERMAGQDKQYVRPDGSLVWANSRATPLPVEDGQPANLLVVTVDLSERKRTEDALRQSEERFRSLAEGIPQLVWRADPDGRWTWASPQ